MSHRDIRILEITRLRGPSMWHFYMPLLEALVDIGDLEDCPSDTMPGFTDRLLQWLPTLWEHRCSYDEPGGFVQRLRDGTWPCHIMEHVAIELQSLAGMPGGYGKAREVSQRGVYKVIVGAWDEQIGLAALHASRDLVLACIEDRSYDVQATVAVLRDLVERRMLGPSTACIVKAATARSIPFIRLNDGNLVQLGYGARMRRIWTAETDATSAIAEGISRDKDLTKRLLAQCGVPVPEGEIVDDAEGAWRAAQDVGLPVVIKPVDGNHGRGVFIDLHTPEQVARAFEVASGEGSKVLVERLVPGLEHRLLVVGGRMVAAARGQCCVVRGDGRHTVQELIDLQINTDPRRGHTEAHPLNPVRIDSMARVDLERQGLAADSVPENGREVLIQRNGNVAFDCTPGVHPDVARDAVLAARVVGLDIAGVDIVAEDIGRPLGEQRGAVVEVNAGPGLLMHLRPASGEAQPVGEAIVEHLFPTAAKVTDDQGRIPVIGVSGTSDTTAVCEIVAHLLQLSGLRTGLACAGGLYIDRRQLREGNAVDWDSGNRLLRNRVVEAAVIESSMELIANEGLAYDLCQVAVLTSLDPAVRLPDRWLETSEHMFKVARTQIDVVLPQGHGVVNADDDALDAMWELCPGTVILYSCNAANPRLASHVAAGGRVIVAHEGRVESWSADTREPIGVYDAANGPRWRGDVPLRCLPAAVGVGVALNLPVTLIRAAIDTFVPDPKFQH